MGQITDVEEYSFMWDGITVGDAAKAPHNAAYGDELMSLRLGLIGQYDRTVQGVIDTDHSDFGDMLELSSPGANTLTIASGAAIVDGYQYVNKDDRDFTVANSEQYRVVLRRSTAAAGSGQQTVRLVLLNTPASPPPAVTQTATVWEIELGTLTVSGGGALTIVPTAVWAGMRVNTSNIQDEAVIFDKLAYLPFYADYRQGGSPTSWKINGATDYALSEAIFAQFGVVRVLVPAGTDQLASTAVTFPTVFGDNPIVYLTLMANSQFLYTTFQWGATPVAATGFTATVRTLGTSGVQQVIDMAWLALGPT